MTKHPAQSEHFQERLRDYWDQYTQTRARLLKVGFIFKGSITLRRISCSQPSCRCRHPKRRHGPYYQVTWKEKAKTVSRFLPAHIVPLYREWIANARTLGSILSEMQAISRRAADSIQAAERTRGNPKKRPEGSKKGR
jgi:hypothetical protein